MFKRDSFVKVIDTCGNYRFGFVENTAERGDVIQINMCEEGLSKISYDQEFALNMHAIDPEFPLDGVKDFNKLLTNAEKLMVPLLAQQMTTSEIAEALSISPVTVRVHIKDLKLKLGVDTREQLFAYCQGIERLIENPGAAQQPQE